MLKFDYMKINWQTHETCFIVWMCDYCIKMAMVKVKQWIVLLLVLLVCERGRES